MIGAGIIFWCKYFGKEKTHLCCIQLFLRKGAQTLPQTPVSLYPTVRTGVGPPQGSPWGLLCKDGPYQVTHIKVSSREINMSETVAGTLKITVLNYNLKISKTGKLKDLESELQWSGILFLRGGDS